MNDQTPPPSPFLTKQEAAARLRCSPQTFDRRRRAGEITAYQPRSGGRLLFRVEDVDAMLVPVERDISRPTTRNDTDAAVAA